jgi:hypothetical protein
MIIAGAEHVGVPDRVDVVVQFLISGEVGGL